MPNDATTNWIVNESEVSVSTSLQQHVPNFIFYVEGERTIPCAKIGNSFYDDPTVSARTDSSATSRGVSRSRSVLFDLSIVDDGEEIADDKALHRVTIISNRDTQLGIRSPV